MGMNKAEFNAYNYKMEQLKHKDPKAFRAVMEQNGEDIKKKSHYPTFASLFSGWGFLALFLLTGFLSGWTVGVLWVVATIAGAGIMGSAIGGLVGHFKYHKYFRALKTRQRLEALQKDGKNHTDQYRLKLEQKLNKDLAYCRAKRLISDAECSYYGNVLTRPQVLADDAVARKKAEIADEARRMNEAMQTFGDDANLIISQKRVELNKASLGDNIEPDRHFVGAVQVRTQKRDAEGKPVVDENGQPAYNDNKFDANSDKDFALILDSISQKLKERMRECSVPFPVTIQCFNGKGELIDILADAKGEIVFINGDMLTSDKNPLESTARSIYDRLPFDPTTPPTPIKDDEEEQEHEDVHEEEQAQTR